MKSDLAGSTPVFCGGPGGQEVWLSPGGAPGDCGRGARSPREERVDALTEAAWRQLGVEAAPVTRFEIYLREHQVKPAHLAQRSGYTRQHILRLRQAKQEPTRRCIAGLVLALRSLTGDRVRASDLFDLGER
jgi:hypothetical protein